MSDGTKRSQHGFNRQLQLSAVNTAVSAAGFRTWLAVGVGPE
jgi:hypothetical protein